MRSIRNEKPNRVAFRHFLNNLLRHQKKQKRKQTSTSSDDINLVNRTIFFQKNRSKEDGKRNKFWRISFSSRTVSTIFSSTRTVTTAKQGTSVDNSSSEIADATVLEEVEKKNENLLPKKHVVFDKGSDQNLSKKTTIRRKTKSARNKNALYWEYYSEVMCSLPASSSKQPVHHTMFPQNNATKPRNVANPRKTKSTRSKRGLVATNSSNSTNDPVACRTIRLNNDDVYVGPFLDNSGGGTFHEYLYTNNRKKHRPNHSMDGVASDFVIVNDESTPHRTISTIYATTRKDSNNNNHKRKFSTHHRRRRYAPTKVATDIPCNHTISDANDECSIHSSEDETLGISIYDCCSSKQ